MDRTQRQAEQREKYAAMSRPRKIGMLVVSFLAAAVTCLLVGWFLGGEWRVGFSVLMGLVVTAASAFMYRDAW